MRIVTVEELGRRLAALPGSEPRVTASGNFAAPLHLLSVLDIALEHYRLFMLNAQPGIPSRPGVAHETPFVGPGMRGSPRLSYIPARLSLVPRLFRGAYAPDAVLLHSSTPRAETVSLGTEVNVLPAAIEACRARGGLVVAQLDGHMPHTHGDAVVPIDLIDLAVEADQVMARPVRAGADGPAAAVAERVAAFVPDGATLQAGIGAVPDAALAGLGQRRGLRVWSEMFSDGLLGLEQAGALDRDADIVASFCFGSAELYEFVDGNERVRMLRTERVNDPGTIAAQPLMVSINSALQVDLFAQANAHRVCGRIYSGLGGQSDFVVGAMHAPGGQAIVALPSWHPKADVSTVVPALTGPATSFQHSHIVTDAGAADIFGRSESEQAAEVIGVAHPRVREELEAAAARMGLAR
ncbi:MAG TPA: acetyl-CoA hydrolase/transferase C-terminal domain-containing protein [Acidimicrobiales bacterium]|nr:acetyl-CoA hydrolase/transferase C-terminal domain-containing protein [Acidimicrobiales bacterium]